MKTQMSCLLLFVNMPVCFAFKVERPVGLKTDHKDTFLHVHEKVKRPRDSRRFFDQQAVRIMNNLKYAYTL